VERILRHGKRLIVLGGGNDISYPDCPGLSRAGVTVLAINIDSHIDGRFDKAPNSGTPYHQLLEEKIIEPSRFFEIAGKDSANSVQYERYAGLPVPVVPLDRNAAYGQLIAHLLELRYLSSNELVDLLALLDVPVGYFAG
jgi:arginase family enzyme